MGHSPQRAFSDPDDYRSLVLRSLDLQSRQNGRGRWRGDKTCLIGRPTPVRKQRLQSSKSVICARNRSLMTGSGRIVDGFLTADKWSLVSARA
jgi:hypothetical protein